MGRQAPRVGGKRELGLGRQAVLRQVQPVLKIG